MVGDEEKATATSDTGEPSSMAHSLASSNEKTGLAASSEIPQGHLESALPEDKIEEALEDAEEDWEHDPENARNWSPAKKWTAVCIVCCNSTAI